MSRKALSAKFGRLLMTGNKWRNFAGAFLAGCWFLTVVSVTIMGRIPTEEPQIELHLFWCIKEAWMNRNSLDWYFVIGNIAMFIPIGIILPAFFTGMRRWGKTASVGFLFSVFIEVSQLVLHRGLFELDDMINNTFGCVLGYALFVIYMWILRKEKLDVFDKIISFGLWMFTVAFLTVSVYLGQPVFDFFM